MCVHWHNWTNSTTEFNTDFISLSCPLNSWLYKKDDYIHVWHSLECSFFQAIGCRTKWIVNMMRMKRKMLLSMSPRISWRIPSWPYPHEWRELWLGRSRKKKAEIYENGMMIFGMRCVHVNGWFSLTHFRSFYHYIRCRMSKNVSERRRRKS